MITSETKRLGIFAGVICTLALIALCGILYFIQKKDVAYNGALRARALRIATENEVKSLENLIIETANDREELAQHILTENSVGDFLSLIGNLAHTRGVTAETRSLAVEAIKGNDIFEYLTLEVGVTGSFESVTQMLPILESLPYQVHVRAVTVERISEAKGDDLWRGSYRLYVTKYK